MASSTGSASRPRGLQVAVLNDERQEMLLGDIPRSAGLTRVVEEAAVGLTTVVESVAMARTKAKTMDESPMVAHNEPKARESQQILATHLSVPKY